MFTDRCRLRKPRDIPGYTQRRRHDPVPSGFAAAPAAKRRSDLTQRAWQASLGCRGAGVYFVGTLQHALSQHVVKLRLAKVSRAQGVDVPDAPDFAVKRSKEALVQPPPWPSWRGLPGATRPALLSLVPQLAHAHFAGRVYIEAEVCRHLFGLGRALQSEQCVDHSEARRAQASKLRSFRVAGRWMRLDYCAWS